MRPDSKRARSIAPGILAYREALAEPIRFQRFVVAARADRRAGGQMDMRDAFLLQGFRYARMTVPI